MEKGRISSRFKIPAVTGVEIAFGRQSFRNDHIVGFEFQVEIRHLRDLDLFDCRSIDKEFYRDQCVIDVNPVIR
jgi:hypothetical protein